MSHSIHIKIKRQQKHPKVDSKQYIAHSYEPSDGIFFYIRKKPIAMMLKHVDFSRQQFRLIAHRLRNRNL
jgi:hypothetical protein